MNNRKLFFGIIVLLVGIIFLLEAFSIVEDAWRLWPLIVILAAIFIIIAAFDRSEPWYKTEDGWQDFAGKMEKKLGDAKRLEKFGGTEKWDKSGKKMEKMGNEFTKEIPEDKNKKKGNDDS